MYSGFRELDEMLGNLGKGELTIVAGRPGMGKTALCWSMAARISQEKNSVAMIVNHEGAFYGGINPVKHYGTAKQNFHVWIDNFDIRMLENTLKHIHECLVLDILFIPHLFPLNQAETKFVTNTIKEYAVATGTHCVLEYNITRRPEKRTNKRPSIDDILCPNTVRNNANNILLVFRDEYYNSDITDPIFEVIVAKASSGELGTAHLKVLYEHIEISQTIPKVYNRN